MNMTNSGNSTQSKKIPSSRIGRKPVAIPSGIQVAIKDNQLTVKGPKGSLDVELHDFVDVVIENNEVLVTPHVQSVRGKDNKLFKSIAGTIRANIFNSIVGVGQGFERKLSLVGVGYRAQSKGKILGLSLGFSHPTDFKIPDGITIETPTQTEIIVKGQNKEVVGEVAAKIRSIRPPEHYKGKGVRYANEKIILKETKKK